MNCKEASRLVSQGLDRNLGLGERLRLRFHLAICDACTNFNKQLLVIRKTIATLRERSGPDPRS